MIGEYEAVVERFFFFHRWTALGGLGLIVEVLRSHSYPPHSVGFPWMSDRPVAETSTGQRTILETEMHDPGGIRNRNPDKRVAVDPATTGRNDA